MSSILSFLYPHELDVVPHPGQSLEPSSRGTTSPAPAGHSADWTWCLPPGQSLDSSSRGTTSPAPDRSTVMPTWCFTPAKALNLRRGAPRRPARPALFHARRTIGPAWHHVARSFRQHQKKSCRRFLETAAPGYSYIQYFFIRLYKHCNEWNGEQGQQSGQCVAPAA